MKTFKGEVELLTGEKLEGEFEINELTNEYKNLETNKIVPYHSILVKKETVKVEVENNDIPKYMEFIFVVMFSIFAVGCVFIIIKLTELLIKFL